MSRLLWGLPSLIFKGNQGTWPGHEVNHSPPSSAKVKNEWRCTSLLIYAFIAWRGKTLPFCINLNEFIKWVVRFPRGIFLFTN